MATKDKTIIREPQVLVFNEKHGERYFHVPNDETLFAVALHVLTERNAEGYWYYKPEPKEKPEAPDVTEEQIATLPKSLQPAAAQKLREYKRALRDYQDSVEDYESIEKALRDKDGRVAWECIRDRGDHEGYSLERYEKIES